jgi:hypothetical protein
MRFVQRQGVWHLINENVPHGANVIATLRNDVEILVLKRFCEQFLEGSGVPPGEFEVRHSGKCYRVIPVQDRGGKLAFEIKGDDGSLARIDTEFVVG